MGSIAETNGTGIMLVGVAFQPEVCCGEVLSEEAEDCAGVGEAEFKVRVEWGDAVACSSICGICCRGAGMWIGELGWGAGGCINVVEGFEVTVILDNTAVYPSTCDVWCEDVDSGLSDCC